ncbi:MAG TPA: hypothetical protein VFA33_17595 [Bryobacteraceae bacterium]|nr:hypothetical protein [Bryobacteraceae bacterium]
MKPWIPIAAAAACVIWAAPQPKPASLPWYMRETAMTAGARLTFLEKSWWPRAKALAEGESFTLDLNQDGRPDTLIERKDGNLIEVIDDSGSADRIDNQASAAYVVSLKGTGLVDRMVVYIDNNGDGKADETEFRHYQDGYLRYAWFSEDYDNTGGPVFGMQNWSYAGTNNPDNRFRGNMMIYLNKYDPETRAWVPLSECPFAFWDFNHDGRSDVVLRVSAAPLASNTGKDSDYANNYQYMWAPKATPLAETGNMNVRYSYNIDPEPRREPFNKPHYNFGFNMVGAQPYNYPHMTYTNPRRRPPQTVVRIPWKDGMAVALDYPAQSTGFSWNEAHDVWRWEGQFWIFEREYMPNTGGPTMRWNMRREYSADPASRRKLYYSEVDQRYHLFGAREGWLEAGHLVNNSKDLEFRYFDSNGDGYLDTFEVFLGSNPVPVRVSRVSDPRARPVTLTREFLQEDYNQRVLPRAIEENRQLIASLKNVAQSDLAAAYEAEAGKTEYLERRRYCLDIARELYFLKARDFFYTRNAAGAYPNLEASRKAARLLTPGPVEGGYTLGDSLKYWTEARRIEQFVEAYANGRFDEAKRLVDQLRAE